MCPRLATQLAVSFLCHGRPCALSLAMSQALNEAVIGSLWYHRKLEKQIAITSSASKNGITAQVQ